MGLPIIKIEFFGKLKKQPLRNSAGIVALILKDDTQTLDTVEYKQGQEPKNWTPENIKYINQALAGGPRKVIVERETVESADNSASLNRLKNKRFDYLAIPDITTPDTTAVVDWIKAKRKDGNKTFKAVLPKTAGDHESIINFTADEIGVGEETYTATQYTARIAGALAGLAFNRSATYLVLPEVTSVKEIDDADTAVDNGELILINDGEKIKIGRGVNSLKTITPEDKKNDDFKSIRVVEIMDMIHQEIHDNFNDNYIGKVPNIYDNQVLFLNDVNKGFTDLAALELLDPGAVNVARVDVAAQRAAHESVGTDTSDWDDEKVKETSFKRSLFLNGKIRIVDTMEDLDFSIEI